MKIIIFTILLTITCSYKVLNEVWEDCETLFPGCGWSASLVCGLKNCNPRGKGCSEIHPDKIFRQTMINFHNHVRNEVAGGKDPVNIKHKLEAAADMNAVSYDLLLEYLSICHVHQCRLDHTYCNSVRDYATPGQNLAWVSDGDLTVNYQTAEGYYEIANYWYIWSAM